MKQFNEGFYTDDFDQEMIDFITNELKLKCTGWTYDIPPNLNDAWLVYGKGLERFFTSKSYDIKYEYLTKQQFKERIGMKDTKKEFTKDDLLIGDVVYLRKYYKNVEYWIKYDQNRLVAPDIDSFSLLRFKYNLEHDCNPDCDIMSVYRAGKLIWKREELSEKDIKLKELEDTLSEMQGNIDKIKQQINQLKS